MQAVNGADGGIQHMRGVEHHRRICGRIASLVTGKDRLHWRFLVRDVDVRHREKMQQARGVRGAGIPLRHQLEPLAFVHAGAGLPGAVAVSGVVRDGARNNHRGGRRNGERADGLFAGRGRNRRPFSEGGGAHQGGGQQKQDGRGAFHEVVSELEYEAMALGKGGGRAVYQSGVPAFPSRSVKFTG